MWNDWTVNYSLKFCPNCRNKGELLNSDIYQDWLKKMKCVNKACSTIWYLCCTCSNVRTHFVTKEQITTHARTHHKQTPYKRIKLDPQDRKQAPNLQPKLQLQQSHKEPPLVQHVR